MNRVIKFRAWDKDEESFVDNKGDLGFMLSGEVIGWLADKGEYEFQQFTGLLDKNGVEIYEGDVVKRVSKERQGRKVVTYDLLYEVKWVDAAFWIQGVELSRLLHVYRLADKTDVEVIGNTFKNPELTK